MTMTSAALKERTQNGAVPDDDLAPKSKSRRFGAEYKLSILEEYERITEEGGKGALLRREGLYLSHIVEWQRAREAGSLSGLTPEHRKKRTPGAPNANSRSSVGATRASKRHKKVSQIS